MQKLVGLFSLVFGVHAFAAAPSIYCGENDNLSFTLEEGIDEYFLDIKGRPYNGNLLDKLTKRNNGQLHTLSIKIPKPPGGGGTPCYFNEQKPLLFSCPFVTSGPKSKLTNNETGEVTEIEYLNVNASNQFIIRESIRPGSNAVLKEEVIRLVVGAYLKLDPPAPPVTPPATGPAPTPGTPAPPPRTIPGRNPFENVLAEADFAVAACKSGELPDSPSR